MVFTAGLWHGLNDYVVYGLEPGVKEIRAVSALLVHDVSTLRLHKPK